MLKGPDLLRMIKVMPSASREDLVRGAGYVSRRKDGGERLNFTAFYEALLAAKGLGLGDRRSRDGEREPRRRGRKLSYHTKVQFNGNLMVGSAYTALLGFHPGDVLEIRLGKHQIRLVPTVAGEEEL
jgi:AbrB-like transcriptional regulator